MILCSAQTYNNLKNRDVMKIKLQNISILLFIFCKTSDYINAISYHADCKMQNAECKMQN